MNGVHRLRPTLCPCAPVPPPDVRRAHAGFDGRFKERQREASVEAALICSEDAAAGSGPMLPGCQAVLRVSQSQLEQVIRDQGQVLGRFRLKLLWVRAVLWWAKPPRSHTHMSLPHGGGAPHQQAPVSRGILLRCSPSTIRPTMVP